MCIYIYIFFSALSCGFYDILMNLPKASIIDLFLYIRIISALGTTVHYKPGSVMYYEYCWWMVLMNTQVFVLETRLHRSEPL